MTHIHTDQEDVTTLYSCIESELSRMLKLLKQEDVTHLEIQLAGADLIRRDHKLLTTLRKVQKSGVGKIPKSLCDTILKEILELEQNVTMRAKVNAALEKASVYFACLERIKGDLSHSLLESHIVLQKNEKDTKRVERGGDASDYKRK